MIRRALILDLETTGANPAADRIIELGVILYSIPARSTLLQFSAVIPTTQANAAEHINGIPAAAISEVSEVPIDAMTFGLSLAGTADVIVGHNCLEFDRVFLGGPWVTKPWLCTKSEFTFPRSRPGDSLVNIALAHGIGVSSAHRALTDCQLIAALFDRMHLFGIELEPLFEKAMRPKALFRALVDYDNRHLAKDAGFQWIPERKTWERRMPVEDAALLPFKTTEVVHGR